MLRGPSRTPPVTLPAFVPDLPVLGAYAVACVVLFVTPGPDMSLFLARTLAGGRRAGIAAMLGVSAGCLAHTLAAALGLSALVAASATAFGALKVVGALYLLWLAWQALRHGSALSVEAGGRALSLRRTFLLGLGVNLTNPKVVLFFVTFLPQFVSAGDPDAGAKLLFLGLFFLAVSVPLALLMILFAEAFIAAVRARPKLLRGLDYGFAALFTGFALRVLAAPAR